MTYLGSYTCHSLRTAISPSRGGQVSNVCQIPCSHPEPTSYSLQPHSQIDLSFILFTEHTATQWESPFGCAIPFQIFPCISGSKSHCAGSTNSHEIDQEVKKVPWLSDIHLVQADRVQDCKSKNYKE